MIQHYGLEMLEIAGERLMILLIHGKGNYFLIYEIKNWTGHNLLDIHILICLFVYCCTYDGKKNISMTTIADQNDKWASYAGPGGWNGTFFWVSLLSNCMDFIGPKCWLFQIQGPDQFWPIYLPNLDRSIWNGRPRCGWHSSMKSILLERSRTLVASSLLSLSLFLSLSLTLQVVFYRPWYVGSWQWGDDLCWIPFSF